MTDDTPTALGTLQVDEGKLRGDVDEVVRSSVEETLNALLDAEADRAGATLRRNTVYVRSAIARQVHRWLRTRAMDSS
jgi:hypothetical protein